MNSADFWNSVRIIIDEGFTTEGLRKLDSYAEQFISGKLIYQRFSPREQYGCSAGGEANVIASLLAGAEDRADSNASQDFKDFQREVQRGKKQEKTIEQWAREAGCWIDNVNNLLSDSLGNQIAEGGEAVVYDHGATIIKSIGLDYFILPILALDRISLHNSFFPETLLKVLGFGRDDKGDFKIICEQPFVVGTHVSDEEICDYMRKMGFQLKNPRNWTYATPETYLSDMHDENVIRSFSGALCVVDCDIRINTPELRQEGTRILTTDVEFI